MSMHPAVSTPTALFPHLWRDDTRYARNQSLFLIIPQLPFVMQVQKTNFTPTQYYVPVLEIPGSPVCQTASQQSLPILADSQRSYRYEYENADNGLAATARCDGMSMSAESRDGKWSRRARSCKFWCVDVRWRLCRRLFAVPLPLLTTYLDLKLCDVLITLPFVAMLFGYAARSALQGEVAASGWPPTIGLSLTFASVVRNNSLLLALTGVSFERALYYHKLFVAVTILLVVLHGWAYLRFDNYDDQASMRGKVVSGFIAFVAMVLLLLLSLNVIRRKIFAFFVRAHWLLFGIVMVYVVVHGATLVLLGVVPWAIDVIYRFVYRNRVYSHGSPTQTEVAEDSFKRVQRGVASRGQVWLVKVAEDMLRVQFRRERVDTDESFGYRAGQYMFICIPMISMLEWHPFTISSSPTEGTVTMHIKVVGDWTRRLLRLAENEEIGSKVSVDILMDGPYGGVSIDIYRPDTYSHFVLLSEGVGVMPMRSVVTWLYHNFQTQSRDDIKRVHFVWSVHNQSEMNALLGEDTLESDSDAFFVTDVQQKSNIQHEIRDRFVFDLYVAQSELDVESDIVQDACKRVHYGAQPDIQRILWDIGNEAKGDARDRVAVLVCGSNCLKVDTVSICMKLSHAFKVSFDVHVEHYQL